MGNILSYSGLSTKIRAMQSRLVTEKELEEIIQLPGVPQFTSYLKRTPEYSRAWAEVDENTLHRIEIEKLLRNSVFQNFSRIYHFAGQKQRKFLDLYSKRYEIMILKEILTNIFDHRTIDPVDLTPYRNFFLQYSRLDIDRLATVGTIDEFISALSGHEFYQPLAAVHRREQGLLFDYGMALDLYYFAQIWNVRKKLFTGNDLEEITKVYGEKFDMLNLQIIHRAKRFYHMEPAAVYSQLVPMNYKLKKEEIEALVTAETYEESRQLFSRTYYGRRYDHLTAANLEEFYNYLLRDILKKEARRDPYSVAVIFSYLYHKEQEVNRLIIALECVRYQVPADEAMRYIRSN